MTRSETADANGGTLLDTWDYLDITGGSEDRA